MEIIHIVLGKANPDRLNGVNKVVYNLATEQHKSQRNVQVWGISSSLVHDYPKRNFKTLLFKAHKNPFKINQILKQSILKNRKAVFHLHGGWIPVFSSLASFFSKNQIRFVITPHGAYNTIAMIRNKWIKNIFFYLFEKKILKKAHKIHAIGQSEVDGAQQLYPQTPSYLLPYGFHNKGQSTNSDKNKDFTIGFVGRLDSYTKGLDLLLEAFYCFQKTHKNSKLWIIGEGEDKPQLEKIIKEKKLTNVVLWGKKFGKEKDSLIEKMHIFAHPSRNEGLPTAVLEAASLGTPVVVSQATNVAQYVTHFSAGIAIENNNAKQLQEAFERPHQSFQNGEMKTYSNGGKKMLNQVFEWAVLVKQYDDLYK